MLRNTLIFFHLCSVIVWVGGMFFAYFCLRPASVQTLEPAKRLPLWAASFERFFRFTAVAVALIVLSGFTLLFQAGFAHAPIGWHIMATLGVVMSLVFAYAYALVYPRLRQHCQASAWPAAAAALDAIRRLVAVNLALAVCTVAVAIFSR